MYKISRSSSVWITLSLVFFLILSLSCNNVALAAETGDTVTLTLLSVNDFHGALADNGLGKDPGAAKLAAFLEQEKAKNPTGTLLLAAGDMFQGSVDSNLLYGKPVLAVMNAVGFDAMAIGNHEFDWGIEQLMNLKQASHFPWGGANIFFDNSLPEFAVPTTTATQSFILLTRDHVKIGIIPLTTPETAIKSNPRIVGSYSFVDPSKVVERLLPELKAAGAQVIVVLAHMGSSQDRTTGEVSGEAANLANDLPSGAVAAIFSGHTHLIVSGTVNDIPIVQAGSRGRQVAEITLVYSKSQNKIIESHQTIFDLTKLAIAADPVIEKIVASYAAETATTKHTVIGQAATDLPHDRLYPAVSLLGEWVTDVMRQSTRADFAFQNGGGLRAGLSAGTITLGAMYEALPFDNTLCTLDMTGDEILQTLEYGIHNLHVGMLEFSGAKVVYDDQQPLGSRVVSVTLPNGQPLDVKQVYKVATNDFLISGGDGYPCFTMGNNKIETGIDVRTLLIDQIKQIHYLQVADDQRFISRHSL